MNIKTDTEPLTCEIVGFWASERPDLCQLFLKGHNKILTDHGLTDLISTDDYWVDDNTVYVVLAISEQGEPIGGIRLEKMLDSRSLPLEKVLTPFDSNISTYIHSLPYANLYEACGLWNAKSAAGNDLGILLCRVCVSVAPSFDIDAILSLNGVYTYKIPRDMGSKMIRSIGENGLFKYPIERFHSALWIQNDLLNMSSASNECQKRVHSLRSDLKQEYLEKNHKNGLQAKYDIYI